MDMEVFVSGPLHMLPKLQEVLKGRNDDVHGLTVSTYLENQYLFCVCVYINAHVHVYSCLQFGPFDRHGQPLREDDVRTPTPDVRTSTKTAATCSNTTTKTETKDTNDVTMDDFWDMIFAPLPPRPKKPTTKTENLTMDDFWDMIFPSTSP